MSLALSLVDIESRSLCEAFARANIVHVKR
jgi:hypothetical protein